MSKMSPRSNCPTRQPGPALSAQSGSAGADKRPATLQTLAVIEIALPSYASLLLFSTEIGLAYFDGRPPTSWLVEPEERWSPEGTGQRSPGHQELGVGLPGATIAEQLRSATSGLNLYSRNRAHVSGWLQRLFSACGVDLVLEISDLRSFELPVTSYRGAPTAADVDWAFQWSRRKVPEMSRVVTQTVRDIVFLQELERLTRPS